MIEDAVIMAQREPTQNKKFLFRSILGVFVCLFVVKLVLVETGNKVRSVGGHIPQYY